MPEELPKLRLLNLQWVQWEGEQVLALQDPLRLSAGSALVPQALTPLLGLLDGTRGLDALRAGFSLRTGLHLLTSQIESFLGSLDDAFLLDNQRFHGALRQAMESYWSGPFRKPALAGGCYPSDQSELQYTMDGYCRRAGVSHEDSSGRVVGLISPHIDYTRGWRTYAETWQRARVAVQEADLIIVLGTDHSGSPGNVTLTRQNYATPWGELPTDTGLVDRLAGVLGEDRAFQEESHHIGEHSIELAAVWLHYMAGGKPKRLLPILCGSHEPLLAADGVEPGPVWDALDLLAEVAAPGKVLVVAAGDLSHVGPAFGDSFPIADADRARVRSWDEQWLVAACSGSSKLLKNLILEHGDPTRICGSAPIHYLTAILGEAQGQMITYDQCPADELGSFVPVAGVLYRAVSM
jgi:AmmeMemoRadiSam system protein B